MRCWIPCAENRRQRAYGWSRHIFRGCCWQDITPTRLKRPWIWAFSISAACKPGNTIVHEEIRLNRRLAPGIYLDVIPIGGSRENPVLGAQPAIEYAVRMRRFAASKQLDRLLASNKILPQHIDSLAATMARFHGDLPAADANSSFGTAEAIRLDAEQNFAQLQALLTEQRDVASLAALRSASDGEYAAHRSLFEQRLVQGYVRECHGDLHLGNIVLVDGQPVPFDGIEFNPALRWIDVMSEIAFTVMDLLHYRRADLAWRFLNAWLEATGDYAGIRVLRFYLVYRAMVRAKVGAIRAAQPGLSARATQRRRRAAVAIWRWLQIAWPATSRADHHPWLAGLGQDYFCTNCAGALAGRYACARMWSASACLA